MKRTSLRRRSKDYKAKQKVKKDKNKALEELYGVKLTYWRYQGRKGIYWHLVSKYVRLRDYKLFGTCISCDKKFKAWKDSQAGHYAPASNCGFGMLFDVKNINAECSGCNNPFFSPGKLIPYRNNLVKRYGEEYVAELDERYRLRKATKEWTQIEYDTQIKELITKIEELENE